MEEGVKNKYVRAVGAACTGKANSQSTSLGPHSRVPATDVEED